MKLVVPGETVDLIISENANLGEHILRVKSNWSVDVPADACIELKIHQELSFLLHFPKL